MKKDSFINYLLVIAIVTVISGIIYATVQQTYRSGANDPQMQIARDINSKLQHGKPVENFFTGTIDIAQSLSVFNVLYDDSGKPIRSSGYLQNKMPAIPAGVFEFAKKKWRARCNMATTTGSKNGNGNCKIKFLSCWLCSIWKVAPGS